jgi:hypothetical protein
LTIQHTFVSVEEKNSVDHGALKTINQLYRDINGDGGGDEDKHCPKTTREYAIAPRENQEKSQCG